MPQISEQLLRDLLGEIEDHARAVFTEYDRKAKRYVWNDEVWARRVPDQFDKVRQARSIIQQIKEAA